MSTSKQVRKAPNPTGKGGFAERPEDRSSGHWDSKNTFSYQMNKFKNMTVKEFMEYEQTHPDSERTVAESLAYARVAKARKDLREFEVVANRTEGMPKFSVDHTTKGDKIDNVNVTIKYGDAKPDGHESL